jgi:D-xylose transport system substrate-binding protein
MIKLLKIYLFFISVLLLSCNSTGHSFEVGFMISSSYHDRWVAESKYYTEKIEAAGGKVIVKDGANDENLQLSQAVELINSGVDILVINAVNGITAASIVRAAHAKGVKVIAYDRIIKNCDLDYFITFDGEKVGELLAEYALKIKPSGNYVLLNGDKSDENALKFYNGTMKALQPAVDNKRVKILFSTFVEDYSRTTAAFFTDKILEYSNTKVDAIITPYDGLAEGVYAVLNKRGLVDSIPVTGQDAEIAALNRIMNGQQIMTVYKPGKSMAYKCAEITIQILNKETINELKPYYNGRFEVPSVILEPFAVDKNNIASTVVADGVFTMDKIMAFKQELVKY